MRSRLPSRATPLSISIQLSRAANAAECRECKSSLKCQSVRPSVWLCELRLTLGESEGWLRHFARFSLSSAAFSQRLSSRWLPSPPNFSAKLTVNFLHFNKHAPTFVHPRYILRARERHTHTHTHSISHPARLRWLEMSHFSARPRGWSFARVRIDIYLYPASDSNKHAWLQAIFAREKYRITISGRLKDWLTHATSGISIWNYDVEFDKVLIGVGRFIAWPSGLTRSWSLLLKGFEQNI